MFSSRLPAHGDTNELTRAVEALRESGTAYVDLTESNPTRAGIPYASGLLDPLADHRALRYEPHPLGLRSARAAVAADQARRGAAVDPEHVVLCASTSEAYSWLFKILCNPGESVLVPRPSYPLFEHLTRFEGIHAEPYDLEYHGRWVIDFESLRAATAKARAVLLVSPNNPTGSYVGAEELSRLAELCWERNWALVADEVFADYPLEAERPVTDIASRVEPLAFTLGGLSKSIGLPQLKLGWVIAGGRPHLRDEALAALAVVADGFLSVGTPVQVALPGLLEAGAGARDAIRSRTRQNLTRLREVVSRYPACEALRVEGGWSAVVRVPATRDEEQLVLDLLRSERILVHPGYFFDFRHEAFIVLSLLTPEDQFADGAERALRFASC